MPNLNEGTLLYMPTTLPGMSVTKAAELLQTQDRIIKIVPGGRLRSTARRAARRPRPILRRSRCSRPIINLKPKDEWRAGRDRRQPDRRDGQGAAVSRRLQCLDHADQGAHRHAVDRHPHAGRRQGVRHRSGRDGEARAANRDRSLKTVPGTSSAYAERVIGGYYLEIVPDRDALARYGLMVGDVQDVIATALGGETVTTTVEGRERYTVNIRYPRDLRSDPQSIATRCAGAAARTAAPCRSAKSPRSS